MAAQKACRRIGIGRFLHAWSYLGPGEWPTGSKKIVLPMPVALGDLTASPVELKAAWQ